MVFSKYFEIFFCLHMMMYRYRHASMADLGMTREISWLQRAAVLVQDNFPGASITIQDLCEALGANKTISAMSIFHYLYIHTDHIHAKLCQTMPHVYYFCLIQDGVQWPLVHLKPSCRSGEAGSTVMPWFKTPSGHIFPKPTLLDSLYS